jgi:hypothetical protein
MLRLVIPISMCLVVPSGLIYDPTILISYNFGRLFVVTFLVIVISTNGISVSTFTCHAYISRDIVFDETMFPFAEFHSNAGARYSTDVLLIPDPSRANSDFSCGQ